VFFKEGEAMPEWLTAGWKPMAAGIAFLVWLVRLESKGLQNERDIKRLWAQRKEDLDAAKASRNETNAMLGEIRDDIKSLIARVGK
jgi:hypothetical protein